VNLHFVQAPTEVLGVAVDGNHIYWTNDFPETIGRANLDGTGVNQSLITGIAASTGVAVDGSFIYWSNFGNTIGRANLDGTGVNESFITGAATPFGIAISIVPVIPVQIGVEPKLISLTSSRPISVTVLGSSNVDVTKIDVTTLRFGPNGATPVSTQIVSANGQVDLVASFRVPDTGLALGDTQACLQGTIDGQPFQACDAVSVVDAECGLGIELVPILPALLWLRGRRRRKLA
jgi:hypothetical protein